MLESAEGSKDDTMGVTKGARELCFTSFLNPCVAFRSVGPDSFLKTKIIRFIVFFSNSHLLASFSSKNNHMKQLFNIVQTGTRAKDEADVENITM